MSALSPGQLVKLSPAADDDGADLPAVVADLIPTVSVKAMRALPGWCSDGTSVRIEADSDEGRHRWTGIVDLADPSSRIIRFVEIEDEGRVERRRAPRATTPFGIEWSPLTGGDRQIGVGRDLSRFGLAFVPTGEAPELGARLVVAVQLPVGAVTAQADVVGFDGDAVRLELALVHPDSLTRITAWEAEQTRIELATQLSEMVRDDPEDEDVEELAGAQPS